IGIYLLSGEIKPWTKILRLGSHIFHPKRTAEQLREKDRRMREILIGSEQKVVYI
ncbi:hypothetical protein MKW92_040369, partial [Papaver armeniacum]